MPPERVILLHPKAPPKPAPGAACNGCGVCCAAEPCPAGMVVSRRRHGACAALAWDDGDRRYRCRLVAEPAAVLPRWAAPLAPALARLARRWISAGTGCDSDLEPQPRPGPPLPTSPVPGATVRPPGPGDDAPPGTRPAGAPPGRPPAPRT